MGSEGVYIPFLTCYFGFEEVIRGWSYFFLLIFWLRSSIKERVRKVIWCYERELLSWSLFCMSGWWVHLLTKVHIYSTYGKFDQGGIKDIFITTSYVLIRTLSFLNQWGRSFVYYKRYLLFKKHLKIPSFGISRQKSLDGIGALI